VFEAPKGEEEQGFKWNVERGQKVKVGQSLGTVVGA
jgi:hypothetical protein